MAVFWRKLNVYNNVVFKWKCCMTNIEKWKSMATQYNTHHMYFEAYKRSNSYEQFSAR